MEEPKEEPKIPITAQGRVIKLEELFDESVNAWGLESFNALLNAEPKKEWIKEHPYVPGHRYIPIDKVEHMLKKMFLKYSIEITGNGTSFNGVWVTVRVHYLHPVTGTMEWHDGIGAIDLQVKKGTSPSDLANINKGAISMAFPIAKTLAVKDACDHFGKVFGADLNRKDTIIFQANQNLDKDAKHEQLKELYELKKELIRPDEQIYFERIIRDKESKSYNKALNHLKQL